MKHILLAWHRYCCQRGKHKTRCLETGLEFGPRIDGVNTAHGAVIIVEWPSFEAFISEQYK